MRRKPVRGQVGSQRILLFGAEEHDGLAADGLMGRTMTAVDPQLSSDALEDAIVAGDAEPAAAEFAGMVMPSTPSWKSRSMTQCGISCSWSIWTGGCSVSDRSSAASNSSQRAVSSGTGIGI